ncbi:MAG: hypothetical protein QW517_10045 [Thermofilaceae archaeon]
MLERLEKPFNNKPVKPPRIIEVVERYERALASLMLRVDAYLDTRIIDASTTMAPATT